MEINKKKECYSSISSNRACLLDLSSSASIFRLYVAESGLFSWFRHFSSFFSISTLKQNTQNIINLLLRQYEYENIYTIHIEIVIKANKYPKINLRLTCSLAGMSIALIIWCISLAIRRAYANFSGGASWNRIYLREKQINLLWYFSSPSHHISYLWI